MSGKLPLGLVPKEEDAESDDDELFRGDDDSSSVADVATRATAEPEASDNKPAIRARALKKPRSTNYSARQLFEMLEMNSIDLEPVWQRAVVWPEVKQSAVIDSIINHYYVPPVLFSMHQTDDGDTLSVCIDGKQRLSSISNFMNNLIPLRQDGRKIWFQENRQEKKFPALSDKARRAFEMEQIAVIEYEGLQDAQEREMFSRVQMGVQLSPAEKLAAEKSPWGEFWRELVKRYFDEPEGNLGHIAKLERGKDLQLMGQICLYIVFYDNDRYVPTSGNMKSFLKETVDRPPDLSFRQLICKTLTKYVRFANDEEYNKPVLPISVTGKSKKFLAPIEFVYVALAIWRFPTATFLQLNELITNMVSYIRGAVKDVMFNGNVNTLLREWLNSQEVEGCKPHGPPSTRKRRAPMDDDDDDYRPSPARQVPRRAIAAAPAAAAAAAAAPAPAPAPVVQQAVQQMVPLHAAPPADNYGNYGNYGYIYQQ